MIRTLLVLMGFALMFSACEKTTTEDAAAFAEETVENISIETRSGPTGCYELVFPISLELPDGSIIEVESREDAKAQVQAWKEQNPDIPGRPHLVFPLEIINSDGELISINSRQELRQIRIECKKEFIANHGKPCFRLVFPVSIEFPDGSTQNFEDRKALKQGLRQWKKDNPDETERPSLVFPIDVKLKEDGSIVTIDSKEELIELKENCE